MSREDFGFQARFEADLVAIDHTGIAVQRTDDAIRLYCDVLGLAAGPKRLHVGERIYITFLDGANSKVEVLEPAGPESAVSRFLEKRGEGMHHVCFRVQNVLEVASRMAQAGYQVIDQQPRIGLEGEKLVFIHPKSSHGVLIELLEPAGDG